MEIGTRTGIYTVLSLPYTARAGRNPVVDVRCLCGVRSAIDAASLQNKTARRCKMCTRSLNNVDTKFEEA